jgi:hypothetical protein
MEQDILEKVIKMPVRRDQEKKEKKEDAKTNFRSVKCPC